MRLYLVQHGEAMSKSENPERPLTEQGQRDVTQVAEFARRTGTKVFQIHHSGKRRAQETAAILVAHLEPEAGVMSVTGLAPRDNVRPIAERLTRETKTLMLVGHCPFMDRLAGLLVADDERRSVVRFQKGGIVCLEQDPKSREWAVSWAVTPALIR